MTLLATIHLDDYAIIASDKKEVVKINGLIVPSHEEAEKIVITDIGLITGSGYVELLNAVKKRVSSEEINHTDKIMEIIKGERDKIKQSTFYDDEQLNELINYSGWLFSYFTITENTQCLRIALYHPTVDENHFCIIRENSCKVIYPSDVDPANIAQYSDYFSANIGTLEKIPDINQNLSYNIKLILLLIDEISRISSTVSKTCDIGVVFRKGEMLLAKNVSIETSNFILEEV